MFKNYYKILGIQKENFDPSELKSAFWTKARECHPDSEEGKKMGEELATEMFKDVNEAFMCFSDEKTKQRYDEIYDIRKNEELNEELRKEQKAETEEVRTKAHSEKEKSKSPPME